MDVLEAFQSYEQDALAAIAAATSSEEIEAVRIEFLGKKKGRLKICKLKSVRQALMIDPVVGKKFNEVKVGLSWLLTRKETLDKPQAALSAIDISWPGIAPRLGKIHPLVQTIEDFKDLMGRLGFEVWTARKSRRTP